MSPAQLRTIALSLPEATEEPHFRMSSFRVRGKIFATLPPEGTHVHVFVGEHHREPALAMHPDWLEKLRWGGKVVGLRVELARAVPAIARDLVRCAWEAKAPKTLSNSS